MPRHSVFVLSAAGLVALTAVLTHLASEHRAAEQEQLQAQKIAHLAMQAKTLRGNLMRSASATAPAGPGPGRPDAKPPTASAEQLKTLIAEVEKTREGAFAPLTQQPFMRAALLPLSGAGGIAVIEWLVFGQ